MRGLCLACFALCAGLAVSQEASESSQDQVARTEHPTVILKQINEINEDGTYTVGYEATDGTFKLETRDEEGNVEGRYGFLDANGEIQIVEYSANNATGFTSNAASVLRGPTAIAGQAATPVTPSPAFALEQQRHAAVIAHQKRVIEKQQQIAQQRDDAAQRQAFAAQRGGQQRRRPVFNAAQFNPNRPANEQFNTQNFNRDFQQFQQQQQFQPQQQQFQPQQQQQFQPQQQQFAPRQQQFQQQPQRPAFESQFQQFQAQQQQQQFAPQQFQQQPQQFQQQPQQFQQQPQQFQQQLQFEPQQQFQQQPQTPALIPTSELTLEDIALEGFSRDEDQDGQIDPLPAHLQPARPPQQPAFQPQQFAAQPQQFGGRPQQQFAGQQQQFAGQQQQFAPQFRQPAPVAPSPAGQQFPPQLSQAQLNQFFQQSQQQQQQPGFQTQFQG